MLYFVIIPHVKMRCKDVICCDKCFRGITLCPDFYASQQQCQSLCGRCKMLPLTSLQWCYIFLFLRDYWFQHFKVLKIYQAGARGSEGDVLCHNPSCTHSIESSPKFPFCCNSCFVGEIFNQSGAPFKTSWRNTLCIFIIRRKYSSRGSNLIWYSM
jgi:hypothetical protein